MTRQIQIILADDHAVVREALRDLLNHEEDLHVLAEAGTGDEAFELACRHRPDLLVLDISMPGLPADQAVRQIRECCPEIRVLVLSMHTTREMVRRMLEAGADRFIGKGASAEETLHTLREVLAQPAPAGQTPQPLAHPDATDRPLSRREREVLAQLAEGYSSKQIADHLNVSPHTISRHRQNIAEKLNLHSLAEQTRYAIVQGIAPLE